MSDDMAKIISMATQITREVSRKVSDKKEKSAKKCSPIDDPVKYWQEKYLAERQENQELRIELSKYKEDYYG